jgi:hypothetical protein
MRLGRFRKTSGSSSRIHNALKTACDESGLRRHGDRNPFAIRVRQAPPLAAPRDGPSDHRRAGGTLGIACDHSIGLRAEERLSPRTQSLRYVPENPRDRRMQCSGQPADPALAQPGWETPRRSPRRPTPPAPINRIEGGVGALAADVAADHIRARQGMTTHLRRPDRGWSRRPRRSSRAGTGGSPPRPAPRAPLRVIHREPVLPVRGP